MNITTSTPVLNTRSAANKGAATFAEEKKADQPKLSAVDAFSSGANKGGNIANTVIGAWNGAIGGGITAGAIAAGANVVSAAVGAIAGNNPLSWGTLIHTAASTALWTAGGAVAGGVLGGVVMNKTGDFFGNIGGKIAKKAGGSEDLGRAIGTVGTGVLAGVAIGARVAGVNGALIALGAGVVGGGLAYLNN
jgi:hypothetical protein